MKATTLLEHQHRKVEATFKKLESGKGNAQALVVALANDLAAHMVIEQEIFYPAVKAVDADLVLESYEEHAIAQYALKRLLETEPTDAAFHARVKSLKELIEHHVKEEEEDLFPEVEKAMGEELEALGKQMKARFDQVVEEGYASALAAASKSKGDPPNGARARAVKAGA